MKKMLLRTLLACGLIGFAFPAAGQELIDVVKIWDEAPHSAFTGLVDYRGDLYCVFREANDHVPRRTLVDDGKIRVLKSRDGKGWESFALLELPGVDLRDPEIVETPWGGMMVVMGGSRYIDGTFMWGRTHVSFWDPDSLQFSFPEPIYIDRRDFPEKKSWLWRVRWFGGTGYGVIYESDRASLVKTTDGLQYDLVSRLPLDGMANETDLWFDPDGSLTMLVRRERLDKMGKILKSSPPYTEWAVYDTGYQLGGPRLVRLPDGRLIAGSREYFPDGIFRTALFEVTPDGTFDKLAQLPSNNDTSYPGMVVRGDKLYMTYYSGHDGKTSIYLATFEL